MADERASSKGDRGLTMVSDKEDPHAIVPDSTENEVTLLESIMIGRASFFCFCLFWSFQIRTIQMKRKKLDNRIMLVVP